MFALILYMILVGCGQDSGNNHGYGWHFDEIGESGLRIRYSDSQLLADVLKNVSFFERNFQHVVSCTGITAPGPLIVVVDELYVNGTRYGGWVHFDTNLVLIEYTSMLRLNHEFVHYLLNVSGFDANANSRHQSDLFEKCGFLA